ncbi:glucocorticoid modulatory element-binding protein 1 isoform X1 [Nerophis ophidion]|uniref:glucocorticoid modulatory element-binding protein 1 isoform X1 n=1 Tax=Nerophis ophidion TaxID=159077 RepID=UPI002AE08972|nr:glucocorticoid modulatory element-binding protein 1 isoform X1 [Nerophis ophidion]XP_061764356.1 glucocorticoid modulatory element-binding protein 1 isoform X1 [Nerophis ophidion]XP_061764357.1 glucocorticoid modulatory element-binding protein 1 isoform X1 [Nerophis ophidion]
MATTEDVSMSTEQVVMVKTDGEPDDLNKTQVILQLQSLTAGDEPAEINASVTTDETHPEDAEEVDVEDGCPITCGDSKAMLLVKKFVCPGINVKCVKYEDQLISPKQFVHISGKATLKDWKRAIRMGGVMLRKIMDSGQLDFYQHSTLCTNTCRSTKFDLLINNTRFPPDGSGLTSSPAQESLEAKTGGDNTTVKPVEKANWVSSSLDSTNKDSREISEETLNFWIGIADVGLLGEVVAKISSELLELLKNIPLLKQSAFLQDTEIAVLSNLGQVFGLLDTVKKMLEKRRQQTDPNQEHILSVLSNLDLQLVEQQKQQQVQSLLTCPQLPAKSGSATKRPTKRPRLQRPITNTTILTSSCNDQTNATTPQFTILSPISLSSLCQPFTVADLPIASLAQTSNTVTLFPTGSQLFTRYMVTGDGKADSIALHTSPGLTLVDASSMQDSGHLSTLVSPVELVHLSQQTVDGDALPLEGQVVDSTMLMQQELIQGEVETNQEHTVIEINPPQVEETIGVMELQLTDESGGDEAGIMVKTRMEITVDEAEETPCQMQVAEAQAVQGVELDSTGSGVQIVVIGENTQDT